MSSNNEYVQNEVKSTPKSPSTEIKTRTLIGIASKNEIQCKSPHQTNTFHQRTQGSTLLIFLECLQFILESEYGWMAPLREERMHRCCSAGIAKLRSVLARGEMYLGVSRVH